MSREKIYACRVCLNCDRDSCIGIFKKINETYVYEKLNSIANINIEPEDGLPDKICSDCLSELENAIIFRQKCQTSNNILVSAIPVNIGIAKQEDDFSNEEVKEEELDSSTDHEYLEEEPTSPPELTLKQEESEEEKHSLQQHLEPPVKPSKAIDVQLECHDCGNLFKTKCKLKVHWFKTHLKAQLTCNICELKFGSFKNFNKHKINRTKRCATLSQVRIEEKGKARVFHCKQCVYSNNYISTMSKHLESHSGTLNYKCNLCPAKYNYLNSLDAHMESKHKVFKKSVVCNICGETMGKRHFYNTHIKKHKADNSVDINKFKCKICNKEFKNKHYLKNHMERHSDVKKYSCDKCEKTFTTWGGVLNHKRKHHDLIRYTYNCDVCKYTNNNKKLMDVHKLNHSKYDNVCTTCGKFFENDTQLVCHEERHTNRNHPCEQCGKTFYTRKVMLNHMCKVHKMYVVDIKRTQNNK